MFNQHTHIEKRILEVILTGKIQSDRIMDRSCDSSSSSSSSNNDSLPIGSSSLTPHSATNLSPKRKAGRKKFRETRHPVYHGVRERKGGKWVCEVREPNKKTRIWLGTYPTPEMAARAHDVAAIAMKGKSAKLNFEDSAWRLPNVRSGNAKDIRKAAAEAAEMFRHQKQLPETTVEMPMMKEVFEDEEAVFNMPGLIMEMAEGLMLTPPAMQGGGFDWDSLGGECCNEDMNLWSH